MINFTMIALMVAMATLDIPLLAERLWLRALVQGLCLLVGIVWWSSRLTTQRVKTYWLLGTYLLILALGAAFSADPLFVILQVGSLMAVLLLSTAFADQNIAKGQNVERLFMHSLGITLCIIVSASLILMLMGSSSAYQYSTGELRFQGVYTEPATLAASAGLIAGYALFGIRYRLVQLIVIVASVICLYQSGSRTYAVALLAAVLAATWICFRRYRARLIKFGLPIALVLAVSIWGLDLNAGKYEGYLRTDSISSLTGRTGIWSDAISVLPEHLLLGFGFTLGTTSIAGGPGQLVTVGKNRQYLDFGSQSKLHSGYIQALLDSGLLGALVYFAIIVVAAWRLYATELGASYPFLCFTFFFCVTANLAETMIQSASVFRSVVGWIAISMALGLVRTPAPVLPWIWTPARAQVPRSRARSTGPAWTRD